MVTRKAPYIHADGSNCWTKNCSRGHTSSVAPESKDSFIKEWFEPEVKPNGSDTVSNAVFIDSIASAEDFALAVINQEITKQGHPVYPYSIYKYSQSTTYNRNWNDITMASRGLVVNDETGEILARPFSKFFNYNEPSVPFELMKGEISVSEKLDGSLGISYPTPEGLQITTAGGFQSAQAAHATEIYRRMYEGKWEPRPGTTYMWEIIYPENRIVVDYGDEDDIYLLGAVDIKSGKSIPISEITEWKGKRATEYSDYKSLDAVINSSERSNHEGFVVHYKETDVRVKYKHEEYLSHHKYATGINARRIWEMLRDKNDMKSWIESAPEEFTDYINTTESRIKKDFDVKHKVVLDEFASFSKSLPKDVSQKDFAILVNTKVTPELRGHFFSLRNNGVLGEKGIKAIWDSIKPDAEKSFWSMNNGQEGLN